MRVKVVKWPKETGVMFYCEGCETHHAVPVDPGRWNWNGDTERPTLSPSLLTTYGLDSDKRCHMFVTDGNAVYLEDCSHSLAGRTIPLPELED